MSDSNDKSSKNNILPLKSGQYSVFKIFTKEAKLPPTNFPLLFLYER